MHITNEMLQVAMKKAMEAGLLPRNACDENLYVNRELIRLILKAALYVAPAHAVTNERRLIHPLRRASAAGNPGSRAG